MTKSKQMKRPTPKRKRRSALETDVSVHEADVYEDNTAPGPGNDGATGSELRTKDRKWESGTQVGHKI